SSRLLVGTGKYKDLKETGEAIKESGAEVVTVALRRTNIGQNPEEQESGKKYGWSTLMLQLLLINSVFSLDSVITAVGMADHLWVMITAVILSMIVMLMASRPIADYVNQNPSIKILALSFLVLIGVSLLAEGFHQHLNKGYVYFAMAFSFTLELINLRVDKVRAMRKAKKKI
ncbi:MAG: TerC family protein, partial [Bacteroidia bacterium]